MNDLAIGRLRVQQRLLAAGEAFDQRYDLFISAVSWESRNATAPTVIGGSPGPTLLLRFASGRVAMDAAKDANQAVLANMCPDYKVLALERSVLFDANADIIATELRERAEAKGMPLRVLVDISCMPKSYISYLVGLGFANGYVSRLDCLYSEGRYNLAGASTQGGRSPSSRKATGRRCSYLTWRPQRRSPANATSSSFSEGDRFLTPLHRTL